MVLLTPAPEGKKTIAAPSFLDEDTPFATDGPHFVIVLDDPVCAECPRKYRKKI